MTDPLFLSFPGTAFVKEGQCNQRRGTETGDRGTAKPTIGCGRIRGRGFVHAPEGSHVTFLCVLCPTPPKRCCHAPTTTMSKPPHQESKGVKHEASLSCDWAVELAQEAPSSAYSQALEVAIPAHITPLCLNVGASKGCTNARLRGTMRDFQPHILPSAHTCKETI